MHDDILLLLQDAETLPLKALGTALPECAHYKAHNKLELKRAPQRPAAT